ncbi:MAG: hypothetical protein SFV54_25460 [Bryobacteraceae bacterium]|nr:hypothetical protein [Bryobacteraceae bacterium]
MSCQAKIGLLVLRPCGEPVAAICPGCGLPLCATHGIGGQCPDCRLATGNLDEDDPGGDAVTRHQYYRQFGAAGYFTPQDRASLRSDSSAAAPAADAFASGLSDYDPFET